MGESGIVYVILVMLYILIRPFRRSEMGGKVVLYIRYISNVVYSHQTFPRILIKDAERLIAKMEDRIHCIPASLSSFEKSSPSILPPSFLLLLSYILHHTTPPSLLPSPHLSLDQSKSRLCHMSFTNIGLYIRPFSFL